MLTQGTQIIEQVRLYVSSQDVEMAAERRFLERYVFPALAIKCLDLRVHFLWSDLSDLGRHDSFTQARAVDPSKV